jgi:hypothetical protein
MALTFRFLIPAGLTLFSLFLMPDIFTAFRFVNHGDTPGIYLSLLMLPLLIPAAFLTMFTPKFGGASLAVVGALGVMGKLLSPSTFHSPFYVGLGPLIYLLALASGIIVAWQCRLSDQNRT